MKNNAIKWFYTVPEKKLYILALMLVQALHGASGVLYALLLRNIVDNATAHDKAGFWHYVVLTVLLVVAQIGMRAVMHWLNELSRATFENTFKTRLLQNLRSMTDKTVVIVTHRPAALEICDRVIDFTNTDGSESV